MVDKRPSGESGILRASLWTQGGLERQRCQPLFFLQFPGQILIDQTDKLQDEILALLRVLFQYRHQTVRQSQDDIAGFLGRNLLLIKTLQNAVGQYMGPESVVPSRADAR